MLTNDRIINISHANDRFSKSWINQTVLWSAFLAKLSTPVRSSETLAEYLRLSTAQQGELKDVGGFVGGVLNNGSRTAENTSSRDLVALDLDNIPATDFQMVLSIISNLNCAYAVYSTRKHQPMNPRLRVLFPLSRTVSAEEYEPIARKIAEFIGMKYCDPTTFQNNRLMYYPSVSSDSQYIFHYEDKPFVGTDGVLDLYADWRDVTTWPVVPGAASAQFKRLARKQGNPIEKSGIVGAFCKNYNILDALETFLPGTYDFSRGYDRGTYTEGSTFGGAILYEDGNFLYSHHSTDPCCGRLVNSFDLVRLHKFGDLDAEVKPNTPTNKVPSYAEMIKFASESAGVSTLMAQERYENAVADFEIGQESTQINLQNNTENAQPQVDDTSWISKLLINRNTGTPEKTIDNALIIIENDSRLKGRIAYDEFAARGLVLGSFPWEPSKAKRAWSDLDDAGLRHYIEKVYGITGEKKLLDATALTAHKNQINAVKDYLSSLTWDSIPRLDTMFIDFLGAEDSEYVRAVARKAMVALVARAMNPGCKWDYMPILVGAQGKGKSTFLDILGGEWYLDGLGTFEGKEASEMIQGKWLVELGELKGMSKAEENTVKQFLSRREDVYREPFGRRTKQFPRQCTFWGTTNEDEFLRDATGNRRFFPIETFKHEPSRNIFTELAGIRDQLFAEALFYYRMGEKLHLEGEVAEAAKVMQDQFKVTNVKEGLIRDFIEKQVPLDWDKRDLKSRMAYWSNDFDVNVATAPRTKICAAEIYTEALGNDFKFIKRGDSIEINAILANLDGWQHGGKTMRFGPYGAQKGYISEM